MLCRNALPCAFEVRNCFPGNFVSSASATTHTFLYASFGVYTVMCLQPDLHQEDLFMMSQQTTWSTQVKVVTLEKTARSLNISGTTIENQ